MDGIWQEVLRRKRMPFLDWLMGHVGDEGDLGTIASRLIEARFSSLSKARIDGDDLPAVLAYARTDTALSPLADVIVQAHADWEHLMSG